MPTEPWSDFVFKLDILSCVPLFTAGEDGKWTLVATATLILVRGRCFFLTAGHAADQLQDQPTSLLLNEKVFLLNGGIWNKFHFDGPPEDDIFDFAVMKVPEILIDELDGNYWLFPEEYFGDPAALQAETVEIYGFPGKKSDRKTTKNEVRPHCSHIVTTEVAERIQGSKRFDSRMHLAVDFDRKNVLDQTGRSITHPDTHGMSGGPAIVVTPKGNVLAGILIEGDPHRDALIYIRSHIVLEWIHFHFEKFR